MQSDPGFDVGFQNVERDRSVFENSVVKFALVEFWPKLFFRKGAEFADFELADFVGEGLAGPRDVAVNLYGDVLIRFPCIVLEELNSLIARPTHRVHAGIYDEAHGAPHFVS